MLLSSRMIWTFSVPFMALLLAMAVVLALAPAKADPCCALREARVSVVARIVVDRLDSPWGMAFLPDGSLLVTEKPGALRHIQEGTVSAPFKGLPVVTEIGQGGLLDIALDPDFETTQRIFFTYAEPAATRRAFSTAVASARIDLDGQVLEDVRVLFSASKKTSGGRHFGSRIRFAPDKTFFVTLGDRGTQLRAQDPFDHAGSVIRLNRDGTIPSDNPFADGKDALPEIWSIGHRNAQGAAIHPGTGKLWTLSHGASGGDEVNVPEAGKNYGWPLISYGSNYSGTGFADGDTKDGLEQPIYYWDSSIAPSGFDFYAPETPLIPEWAGSVFAGALRGQHLSRLILDGETVVAEERYFEETFGRIRDVRSGPDGALWILTDDGALVRVTGE